MATPRQYPRARAVIAATLAAAAARSARAPVVRPAVRGGPPPSSPQASPAQLAAIADAALLHIAADGAVTLEIAITDAVFPNLACTLTLREGRAHATFVARDPDTRRLLAAESGRLRAALEARGLKVAAIDVRQHEDD